MTHLDIHEYARTDGVTCNAVRYDHDNYFTVHDFLGHLFDDVLGDGTIVFTDPETLLPRFVHVGEWLCHETNAGFYVCIDSYFTASFKPVKKVT